MWFRPVLAGPTGIAEDIEMIFPLRIMAPAFVAATGATKRSEGAQIDHSLPDFFGPASKSAPKAEQPAAVVEEPAVAVLPPTPSAEESAGLSPAPVGDVPLFKLVREDPVPVVVEAAPAAPVAEPGPAAHIAPPAPVAQASPAVESASSPADVVARACELPGVSGAVVALEEGLVVAQKLPTGLSADTFAAFMPQIFGRLEKYTAEMQLGAATGITIETADGPCHIARLGKIYFGTVGRAGEKLPDALCDLTRQLAAHIS